MWGLLSGIFKKLMLLINIFLKAFLKTILMIGNSLLQGSAETRD